MPLTDGPIRRSLASGRLAVYYALLISVAMGVVPLIAEGTLGGGLKFLCVLVIGAFFLKWPRGALIALGLFLGLVGSGTLLLMLPMHVTGEFVPPAWLYGWVLLDAIGVVLAILGAKELSRAGRSVM